VNDVNWGFHLGVVPGLLLAFRNMWLFYRLIRSAEAMARKNGEWLDFTYSFDLKTDYLLRPAKFVKPDDSPAMRVAKESLLAVRRQVFVRHSIAALVLVIGGLIGGLTQAELSRGE